MVNPPVEAPSQAEGSESPAPEVVESPPPVVEDERPIVDIPAPEEAGAPDTDAGGAKPEGDGEADAERPAATETVPEADKPAVEPVAETPPADAPPTDREKAIQSAGDKLVADANKKVEAAEQRANEAATQSREAQAIVQARDQLIRSKMSDPNNPRDEATARAEATAEVGDAYERILLERRVEAAETKVTAAEQGRTTTELQALALSVADKAGIDDPADRGRVLAMGSREAMQDMAQIIVDAKAHRNGQIKTKEAEVEPGGPTNTFDGGGGTGTTAPMTDEQIVAAYGDVNGTFNDNKAYNAAIARLGWG